MPERDCKPQGMVWRSGALREGWLLLAHGRSTRLTRERCRDPRRPLPPGELLAHCRTRLTAFKVPREIRIVAELPRNSSGKLDKRALLAQVP